MGLRHFSIAHIFSLIISLHLGRHLGYIEMLNDARVASLGFFKESICTTRINKEKKFKIKFQVLKSAQILLDYRGLMLWLLSDPPGFTCWISFAPVISFVYCSVLIFAKSFFYILIYMF